MSRYMKPLLGVVRMSGVLAATVLSGLPTLVPAQETAAPVRTEQQIHAEAIEAMRVEMTMASANQGNAVAQFDLGMRYLSGHGVAQSDTEAVHWYRQAAAQGHAGAQIELGLMYENGRGVPRDATEAARWYLRAAEQGNMYGQYNIGFMYRNGNGVARDATQAAHWYRKAAEQGHADAQNNLGLMYSTGLGVARDAGQAVHWYRKAAEQGYPKAQLHLGVMYATGQGVPRDVAQAEAWYKLAAEQGDVEAANNLRRMAEMRQATSSTPHLRRDTASASQTVPLECFAPGNTSCRAASTSAGDTWVDNLMAIGGIIVAGAAIGSMLSPDDGIGKTAAAGDHSTSKTGDCRKRAEASIAVCDVSFGSCTSYGKCSRQVTCSPAASCGSFLTHVDFYDGGRYYCDNRSSWILSTPRTISKDRETTLRSMMNEMCP